MKVITVRHISPELSAALEAEKHRRGLSLNGTVIALVEESLGLGTESRSNGLRRLAGTWTEEEHKEFESSMAAFGSVDEELWR